VVQNGHLRVAKTSTPTTSLRYESPACRRWRSRRHRVELSCVSAPSRPARCRVGRARNGGH
jgi:hypothetical protein